MQFDTDYLLKSASDVTRFDDRITLPVHINEEDNFSLSSIHRSNARGIEVTPAKTQKQLLESGKHEISVKIFTSAAGTKEVARGLAKLRGKYLTITSGGVGAEEEDKKTIVLPYPFDMKKNPMFIDYLGKSSMRELDTRMTIHKFELMRLKEPISVEYIDREAFCVELNLHISLLSTTKSVGSVSYKDTLLVHNNTNQDYENVERLSFNHPNLTLNRKIVPASQGKRKRESWKDVSRAKGTRELEQEKREYSRLKALTRDALSKATDNRYGTLPLDLFPLSYNERDDTFQSAAPIYMDSLAIEPPFVSKHTVAFNELASKSSDSLTYEIPRTAEQKIVLHARSSRAYTIHSSESKIDEASSFSRIVNFTKDLNLFLCFEIPDGFFRAGTMEAAPYRIPISQFHMVIPKVEKGSYVRRVTLNLEAQDEKGIHNSHPYILQSYVNSAETEGRQMGVYSDERNISHVKFQKTYNGFEMQVKLRSMTTSKKSVSEMYKYDYDISIICKRPLHNLILPLVRLPVEMRYVEEIDFYGYGEASNFDFAWSYDFRNPKSTEYSDISSVIIILPREDVIRKQVLRMNKGEDVNKNRLEFGLSFVTSKLIKAK